MPVNSIIPTILCGGTGSRLWPLSRESFPKQYLSLFPEDNKSMLQKTVERTSCIKNISQPILVCNEDHRFIVAEQMQEINISPKSILLEPIGKNTAPAICLASLIALEKEEDPILLVLSSDHEIKNNDKFIKTVEKGIDYALEDKLVTFGVVPTSPETGYGYIKSTNPFDLSKINGEIIDEFTEKPSIEKAMEFILDKRYTWNSGMFIFKAQTIIKELNRYAPDLIQNCQSALCASVNDLDFQRINKKEFEKCKNISIDIAVMEKTKEGIVLPLDAGWSDIGSWKTVWESAKKDQDKNVINGKVILQESKNCYVRSNKRLVVGINIEDLIIVDTADAILISKQNKSQKVKDIVQELKKRKIPEGQKHKKIYRPWGYYLSVVEDSRWQVKKIQVKPGEKLSLQMHHHRSEHWIVVSGTADVQIEDKKLVLTENQSVYIPLGSRHRLSNPGKIPLILIEVQSGSYVGEDDIVRFEDKYGR